jgi:hypothetical protein
MLTLPHRKLAVKRWPSKIEGGSGGRNNIFPLELPSFHHRLRQRISKAEIDSVDGAFPSPVGPGPAMKLVGPLAACSPGLRLALAHEIERHCGADESLQGRLIDLVAFVDIDGAPDIPLQAGIE